MFRYSITMAELHIVIPGEIWVYSYYFLFDLHFK